MTSSSFDRKLRFTHHSQQDMCISIEQSPTHRTSLLSRICK